MRLIDADELYDKFEEKYKNFPTPYRLIYRGFVDEIADALTVDAKPVIHAKWIKYENHIYDEYYYSCSSCGNEWVCIGGSPEENGINYCPHCGATKVYGGLK